MRTPRIVRTSIAGGAVLALGILTGPVTGGRPSTPVQAQGSGEAFMARLSWVPTTVNQREDVTGRGRATATLSGTRLSVEGEFEGLAGAATRVELGEGFATGARGFAIVDLTITRTTSGTISGSATLTAEQVEHLREGRLYLHVFSTRGIADEGGSNLVGWLLPE